MKKILFIILCTFLITGCSSEDSEMTDSKALFIAKKVTKTKKASIYVSENILSSNTEVGYILDQETLNSPDYNSWLIVVDLYPYANLSHPHIYIFVDSETGSIETLEHGFPPIGEIKMKEIKKYVTK